MALQLSEDNDRDEWKLLLSKLRLVITRFDDTLRQCLFKVYLDKNDDDLVDAILGYPCSVSMQKVVDGTFKNLIRTLYSYKNIQYDIQVNEALKRIDAHSCFYSFIYGVFSLILDSAPKNSFFEITYDGGRRDNQITVKCEQCNFKRVFDNNQSELIENRISMYKNMVSEWNGAFIVQNQSFKILLK